MPLVEENAGGGDPRVLAQVLAEYKAAASTPSKRSSTKPTTSGARKVKTFRNTTGTKPTTVGSHSPRRETSELGRFLKTTYPFNSPNKTFASWSWSHGHLVVTPAHANANRMRASSGRVVSTGAVHEIGDLLKVVSRGSSRVATASEKVSAGAAVVSLLGLTTDDPLLAGGGAVVSEGAGVLAIDAKALSFATHPTKKGAEAVLAAVTEDFIGREADKHGGGKKISLVQGLLDFIGSEGFSSIQGGSKKR